MEHDRVADAAFLIPVRHSLIFELRTLILLYFITPNRQTNVPRMVHILFFLQYFALLLNLAAESETMPQDYLVT